MIVMPTRPKFAEPTVSSAESMTQEADFSGQRRLIRPNMKDHANNGRAPAAYGHNIPLTARALQPNGAHEESSYAEVFYFQKQIQAQTRMMVVLENGEQLEGVIEWYDRYAIKLRNVACKNGGPANASAALGNGQEDGHTAARSRVLIYKDCIRYIYKTSETAPQTMT